MTGEGCKATLRVQKGSISALNLPFNTSAWIITIIIINDNNNLYLKRVTQSNGKDLP